ncbi:telomere-capping, CST complex subunit-domain-containing protein [Absidia repens]|uniref:Telomere-capping, CST complex subunit-domain-containing protein n=1 Tax=Absidia repens TaxID=90262 RepID=A0A1X2IZ33_9FUNG|nr:telomere-capping, CST complex subunit-domain-containing protein [Absidia repens]
MTTLSSGKHVFIEELVENPQKYDNTSIRVLGRLIDYHAARNTATMVSKNASLRLNTELVEIYVRDTCLVQCIGEVHYDQNIGQLVLKPRILRNMDIVDIDIYEKTVLASRQYDKSAASP